MRRFSSRLPIQPKSSLTGFAGRPASDIRFLENDAELYFEEEEFDAFAERFKKYEVICVRQAAEYPRGQKVIGFYDPDMHVIEACESMMTVCRRFKARGMTVEEISKRTMFPKEVVTMFPAE